MWNTDQRGEKQRRSIVLPRVKACDQGPLRRNYVRFVLSTYETMEVEELRKTVKNLADLVTNPPRKRPRASYANKKCVECKKEFTPAWPNQISCTDTCAMKRKKKMDKKWMHRMKKEGVF